MTTIAGRYRIDDRVGQGGSATVFAAVDTWLDSQPVAIKVLTTTDRTYSQLLAREFALLFPIRHPHMPLVYELGRLPADHGIEGVPPDAPFLVEELCAGEPAPEWAVDRPPAQIAAVGAQIAAALAALHARGIQHGDIKPENILVEGDDQPTAKLIDFNLAVRGQSSSVSGTLRYMAPEALGGARSTASDIYSLGATLVELITGEPPTEHHGAQLCAPDFDGGIRSMTYPDPERRIDAANAFEHLLLEVDDELRDRVNGLRNNTQTSTGFAGREPVVRAIDKTLAGGTGTHVLRIVGGPGSGKTAALTQAVLRAAIAGRSVAGAVRPGRRGELAEVERAVTELGGGEPLEAPTLADDPRTEQWQQFARLSERLSAADMPITLVFDDVPPDSPLDRFAGFLERSGEQGPRLVWVQASTAGTGVPLPPLDAGAVAAAIRVARPLRPQDANASESLRAASGGVPQTAITLLNSFPGDTLLKAARDGDLARTDTLRAVVEQRLARLGSDARDLVSTVAALTPPVPLSLVREIPGSERFTDATIEEAIATGLLVRSGWDAGPALTIAGDALADTLRRLAPDELLRGVADTLAAADVGRERAAELGHLWQRLGEPERAKNPLLEGARFAAASLRLADALDDYDSLLELDLDDDSRDTVRVESSRLLVALGRGPEAVERLEDAHHPEARIALAEALLGLGKYRDAAEALNGKGPTGEDDAMVEALAARALLHAGDHAAAQQQAEAAIARRSDHPRRAELESVLGLCAYYRGDLRTALDTLNSAADLADKRDDVALVDSTRANQALVLHKSGDVRGAERAYSESLAAARSQRDLPRQLRRLTNLAALRQDQGNLEAALAGYQEAHDLARLVDGQREMVHVALNWGNLLCFLGDANAAHDRVAPALTSAERLGMKTERAYLELVNAEIVLAQGDSASAGEAVDRANQLFAGSEDTAGSAEAEAVRAQIALHRRESAMVREHAQVAADRAAAAGRERIEGQALIWLALGDLSEPSASPDAAIAAAVRAADIAQRRGDTDLGWLANATASRLHARTGRAQDALFHMKKARSLATAARSRLSARYERSYGEVWYRRELWAAVHQPHESEPHQPQRDLDRLLAINRELAQDHNPERLLERIIDAAIALSGAERGFIVLREDGASESLMIRAARNIDQESVNEAELSVSRSIAIQAMQSGMPVTSVNAIDDDRFAEFLSVHEMKLRSVLCLPLRAPKDVLGALYLDNRYRVNAFSEADVALLSAFGDQAAIALANARFVRQLDVRSRELERSRAQIEELNQQLEQELAAQSKSLELARSQAGERDEETGRHGMIGRSTKMREVFRVIDRVADKDVPITVLGESGTGKELVARAIHTASPRAEGPFVSINCGAIPGELLESELFGHERGAFTGAVRSKPGLFEVARTGTMFLDEIGDMPLTMQVKLLRVLQEKEFRRVGGTENLSTDARVVSASNQDLETMVRDGGFREDLWYRLNVVEVHLPPLRQRQEDVPLLIDHLLTIHGGDPAPNLTRDALAAMLDYNWPGNVRELENEIQRAVALADGEIAAGALSEKLRGLGGTGARRGAGQSLKEAVERFEADTIRAALAEHGGKVAAAARALGLTRAGLYKKINKYGLAGDR